MGRKEPSSGQADIYGGGACGSPIKIVAFSGSGEYETIDILSSYCEREEVFPCTAEKYCFLLSLLPSLLFPPMLLLFPTLY